MDMATELEELSYRLLASAANGREAQERAAIVAHWVNEQSARVAAGRKLRLDNDRLVEEALAAIARPLPRHRPRPTRQLTHLTRGRPATRPDHRQEDRS